MLVARKNVILKNEASIELRSPLAQEADLLLHHLHKAHAESYRNLNQMPDYWLNLSVDEEKKILTDFQESKSKFMLAAFHQNKIVGGLGFFGALGDFLKHTGRIGMSIQSAYCNSGLGTEMLTHAIHTARENGFHRVELTVRTYNEAGIALYEKTGFRRVGLLKHAAFIDNEYADEFLYELILN